jgi:hypothetical protein
MSIRRPKLRGDCGTDPDEYTRLYALAEKVFAGYGDYREETAALGRQIPIFRLKTR